MTRQAREACPPPPDRETEKRVVEALIFVSDEPITLEQLGQALGRKRPEELQVLVEEIGSELEASSRGLRLEHVAGGYRFSTCPELAAWVRAHFRNRNRSRLSPASIETLAVIAYKQPVTAPEIQEIRGVDPQGSIKTLLEKRLIRIAGKKKVVGRPFLWATTREFLMHFGLASIEDLPPIEDFERLAGGLAADDGSEPGAVADVEPEESLPRHASFGRGGAAGADAADREGAEAAMDRDGAEGDDGDEVGAEADAEEAGAKKVDIEEAGDEGGYVEEGDIEEGVLEEGRPVRDPIGQEDEEDEEE